MSGDEAAAWDLTQETFLKAHRARAQYRGDSALGWLYRIAGRCFLDGLRKKEPIPVEDVQAFLDERELDRGMSLEERIATEQLIVKLVSRAPRDVREIVLLRYFDELELEEIARTLEINERTVRRKLERFLVSTRKLAGSSE